MRKITVRKLLIGLFACACIPAFAATYYVDAVKGDDAGDGSAAHPRKTLVKVMELAKSGDIVYAAAGTYDKGAAVVEASNVTSNRVVIPAGVRLESTEGAEKTFIVGAPAPGTSGNGLYATRCVALNGKGAAVVGFTLTGGHTATTGDYANDTGGAVRGAGRYSVGAGYVVSDCIVSNNTAKSGCSPAGEGVTWVRCRLSEMASPCCYYGQLYCCYVKVASATWNALEQPRVVYGCSIYGSIRLRSNSANPYVGAMYNSIVCKVETPNNYEPGAVCDSLYCTVDQQAAVKEGCKQVSDSDFSSMVFDDYGRTSSALVRDGANNAHVYALPTKQNGGYIDGNEVPTAFLYPLDEDMNHGQRIYNATVDFGAAEYDIRPDIAAAIALGRRVAVDSVTTNVTVTAEDLPVLSNACEMALVWTKPSEGGGSYEFTVRVAGAGTLCCYKDGAAEPFARATAGMTSVKFSSAAATVPLRFTFAGEGYAVLSSFCDQASATITAEMGGLTMKGDSFATTNITGTQVFIFTNALTVTILRNFNTPRLCTGFNLNDKNGTNFIDFAKHPGGWTHAFDSLDSSVVIEATYKDVQDFYVDPVKGNDGKSGFLPSEAWRTLATIKTNGNVRSGDTVYAAAGTYDKGALKRADTALTLNRAVIPAGVRLESLEGAEKTFIVGAPAPGVATDEAPFGCGEGATRCVVLEGTDSSIAGFTLTGGRTGKAAGTSKYDYWNGAVFGPTENDGWYTGAGYPVYDCIVSNNVAWVFHAGVGITWVRCNIVQNGREGIRPAAELQACCQVGHYYNCNFDGNKGATYDVSQPQSFYGCRAGSIWLGHGSSDKYAYNSIVKFVTAVNNAGHAYLADCVFVSTNLLVKTKGNCQQITAAEYAAMGYDIDGRTTSMIVRDAGNNEWTYAIPAAYGPEFDKGKGQRIYNARVDVGPYEYDIRPDLATILGDEAVVVASASTNVVETENKVRINDNQTLCVTAATAESVYRIFPVHVENGTLTVEWTVEGEVKSESFTADGQWSGSLDPGKIVTFKFVSDKGKSGFAELTQSGSTGFIVIMY